MHIVDAITGQRWRRKPTCMTERDTARDHLKPWMAGGASRAELAAAAKELGVEYPAAEEAPAKGK